MTPTVSAAATSGTNAADATPSASHTGAMGGKRASSPAGPSRVSIQTGDRVRKHSVSGLRRSSGWRRTPAATGSGKPTVRSSTRASPSGAPAARAPVRAPSATTMSATTTVATSSTVRAPASAAVSACRRSARSRAPSASASAARRRRSLSCRLPRARARSMDSQQRCATVRSSSTSSGSQCLGVRWCRAIPATKRPALWSGMEMTARICVCSYAARSAGATRGSARTSSTT